MNSAQIAQLIVQLLPYGVQFTTNMVVLIHKTNPTLADWQTALALAQTPFTQGLNAGVLVNDAPVKAA